MIKIAYWIIGLTLTIWLNVVMFLYGSEAALLPLIMIIIIGMPSSYVAYLLFGYLLSKVSLGFINNTYIETNIITLFALYAGYLQWFHIIGNVIRNEGDNEEIMRNMRNINAGKINNESNN